MWDFLRHAARGIPEPKRLVLRGSFWIERLSFRSFGGLLGRAKGRLKLRLLLVR